MNPRPHSYRDLFAFLAVVTLLVPVFTGCGESVVAPVAQAPPQFELSWGAFGSAPGDFNAPQAVAVDRAGNVYVTDASLGRVQKFTADGGFLMSFGEKGSGPGQLLWPNAVAVDADGVVYVSDIYNYRIQKFDAGGNDLGAWDFYARNYGLAVNARNALVLSGYKVLARRLDRSPLQKEGPFLFTVSAHGIEQSRVASHDVGAIALDGFGSVFGMRRLYVDNLPSTYVVEMRDGEVLREWKAAVEAGEDIAVANGSVYLSGTLGSLGYVVKHQASGHLLAQWRNVDYSPDLGSPVGLAVNTYEAVFVADYNHKRVVKYGYPLPR